MDAMEQVTFDESPASIVEDYRADRRGLTGFLMRHKIVRTLAQAQMLIVILSLVIFIGAGALIRSSVRGGTIDTAKNLVPAIPSVR